MKTDFVYIVEDDSIASFVIKLSLDSHLSFTENEVFHNGQLAYDKLTENINQGCRLPDLIFLDLNMPVMDGWEFLQAFSELKYENEISVIILTSSINPEDVERAKKFSVVKGFLSKPLTSDKLEDVIELV